MSQTSLPPPTKNSQGPLVIGSVLVLLTIGGVVVWRTMTGEQSADTPEPTPVVATNPSPLPAPPPPPPEATEDTTTTAEAPSPTPKATALVPPRFDTGCSGTCSGSADSTLRAALRQRGGAAKGCYDKALRSKPTLQGKLMVALRLSPNGSVCSASVVSDSLGDASVSNCIMQNFRSASYPKPKGGCVDVQVPLNLVPSAQ